MKVLLMYMPDTLITFGLFMDNVSAMSLESIAGNIEDNCNVKILDLLLCRKNLSETIRKTINKFNPDLVGLSCMSFQYDTAIKITKFIKSLNKNMLIALGGYHPTLMYKQISKSQDSDFIDFIIRGEGEFAFKELINAIEKNKGFEKIDGLSYKKNGKFVHNPRRKLLDINEIKLPKRKNIYILKERRRAVSLPTAGIETSRGCTNMCKFCSIGLMYGQSFRTYRIDRVIEDIGLIKEAGFKHAFFTDDNILLDVKRFKQICDAIKREGHDDIDYFVQLPVRELAMDKDISKKMAQAGFTGVFLGIENIITNVSAKWNKLITPKLSENAIKNLHTFDIIVTAGIVLGNPEDGRKDFDINLKFAKKNRIDLPLFFTCTPYPKTRFRKEMLEKGLIINKNDFSKYDSGFATCKTYKLSAEEIQFLIWKLIRDFFDFEWLINNKIGVMYPKHFYKFLLKELSYLFTDDIYLRKSSIESCDKLGILLLKNKLLYPFIKKTEKEVFEEYLTLLNQNNVFDLDLTSDYI